MNCTPLRCHWRIVCAWRARQSSPVLIGPSHAARIENLRYLLARTYPRIAQSATPERTSSWAGLRPMSCDGVPIIGRTACENLFLNTGHGPLGWTMAVGSGRALADLMVGRTPEIDLAPYSLQRFS